MNARTFAAKANLQEMMGGMIVDIFRRMSGLHGNVEMTSRWVDTLLASREEYHSGAKGLVCPITLGGVDVRIEYDPSLDRILANHPVLLAFLVEIELMAQES
jgi:hypothetical protein